jgi:hypothetical protein
LVVEIGIRRQLPALQPSRAAQAERAQIRIELMGVGSRHASTADPVRDEFCAGFLENLANLGKGADRDPPAAASSLGAADRTDGKVRALGEFRLVEAQQRAGGMDLFRVVCISEWFPDTKVCRFKVIVFFGKPWQRRNAYIVNFWELAARNPFRNR